MSLGCDTFPKTVPYVPCLQGATLKLSRTSHASKVWLFSENCPGCPMLPRCDTFPKTVPDVPRLQGATLFQKLSRTSHDSKVRHFSENCHERPTTLRCDIFVDFLSWDFDMFSKHTETWTSARCCRRAHHTCSIVVFPAGHSICSVWSTLRPIWWPGDQRPGNGGVPMWYSWPFICFCLRLHRPRHIIYSDPGAIGSGVPWPDCQWCRTGHIPHAINLMILSTPIYQYGLILVAISVTNVL